VLCQGGACAAAQSICHEIQKMNPQFKGEKMGSIRSLDGRIRAIGALLVVGGVLSACSTSSGASSGSATTASGGGTTTTSAACSAAKKEVASISNGYPFPASLPAVNTTELKGKTIWAVFDDMTNPTDVATADGFEAAAASVGATVKLIDGQGTPSVQTEGVLSAVSAKPAAIYTRAIVSSSITDGLAAAAKAGIPVMMGYPGIPEDSPGYYTQGSEYQGGIDAADVAFTEAGCNPNAQFGLFTTPILTNMDVSTTEFSADMMQICPGCKIYTEALSLTTLATQSGPDAVSMVQAHPGISVVISAIDPPLLDADPALISAQSKVNTIGMTANVLADNQYIKSGQETDLVNLSGTVDGWVDFDQMARQLAKAPAYTTWENIPFTVMSKADFSTVYNSQNPSNFEAVFEKAWGVAK
jgi:ribose transport system substrate-binding protein